MYNLTILRDKNDFQHDNTCNCYNQNMHVTSVRCGAKYLYDSFRIYSYVEQLSYVRIMW